MYTRECIHPNMDWIHSNNNNTNMATFRLSVEDAHTAGGDQQIAVVETGLDDNVAAQQ